VQSRFLINSPPESFHQIAGRHRSTILNPKQRGLCRVSAKTGNFKAIIQQSSDFRTDILILGTIRMAF
jgi:hypothetical protein